MQDRGVQISPLTIGRRLREARRERGFTQEQIAEHLGLARTTIVAIEKGGRRVTPEELIKLAELYGRSVNELLRPGVPVEGLAAQFRLAMARKAPEVPELERLVLELQRLAEDYVELERITGSKPARSYPPPHEVEGLPPEPVGEQAAIAERSRLGLGDGPVLQLRELLEHDVGLRVFVLDLPSSVAGLFAYSEEAGGCVAINSKHPAERQRWSLAHEYGHFLTNRYRPEITLLRSYQRLPAAERMAEEFAANFLIPATGLTRRFAELKRARPGGPTPADLLQLAHLYQVSLQALIFRLEALRLLRPGTWDHLEAAGFRVGEARRLLDLSSLEPDTSQLPARYRYLAVEAYLKGLISEGQFARFLRMDRVAARAVAQELARQQGLTEEGNVAPVDMDLSVSAPERPTGTYQRHRRGFIPSP